MFLSDSVTSTAKAVSPHKVKSRGRGRPRHTNMRHRSSDAL